MKKWIGLVGVAVALSGCSIDHIVGQATGPKVVGSGKTKKVHQSLGSFRTIEFDGAFDSEITVGKATDLTIEGDDNIVPLVKTKIENGRLRIYVDGSYSTSKPLKVTLGAAQLEGASVNGSGEMHVRGVKDSSFSVAINGSGSAIVDGKTDSVTVAVNGSGEMDLKKLKSKSAQVAIHGSGEVNVAASDSLSATIAGSGSVRYSGNPKVSKTVAGSGEVIRGE